MTEVNPSPDCQMSFLMSYQAWQTNWVDHMPSKSAPGTAINSSSQGAPCSGWLSELLPLTQLFNGCSLEHHFFLSWCNSIISHIWEIFGSLRHKPWSKDSTQGKDWSSQRAQILGTKMLFSSAISSLVKPVFQLLEKSHAKRVFSETNSWVVKSTQTL